MQLDNYSPNTVMVALLLFPATANAQSGGQFERIHQQLGGADQDRFGSRVCHAGDINQDGFEDYLVGAPSTDVDGHENAGSVYIYSGATQTLLYQFDGGFRNKNLGKHISGVGDVNGDGFDDILIGNPDASPNDNHKAGSAWVYSGADGSLIYQFHGTTYNKYLGGSVSGAGDINNDGFPDFMFKDFLDVVIHSGVDGSLIYRLTQPSGAYGFGQSLAAMGDVDEDGFGDILIGAPHADVNFIEAAGRAFIYSGATGQLLYEFEGQHYELELGYAVACAGDVNADGIQDALLGSNGGVYLYSGANGDHLFELEKLGYYSHFGIAVSGAGDLDQDGHDDFLVGDPPGNNSSDGKVFCYSEATGKIMLKLTTASEEGLGFSVSGLNDVNGDGDLDFIVGLQTKEDVGTGEETGCIEIHSLRSLLKTGVHTVSAADGGNVIFLLDFPADSANLDFKILASQSGRGPSDLGIYVPLTRDRMAVDSYYGRYPNNTHFNLHGELDATGKSFSSFYFPRKMPSFMIGSIYYFAAVVFNNNGTPKYSSIARTIEILP